MPAMLHFVRDESELQTIVRSTPGSVRALGSRLSQPPLLMPRRENDKLLDLGQMRGVLGVEQSNVTFAAGTTLEEVHRTLTSMHRMLPCSPGVISCQTLAGALSTGTHGQGLGQSSFADTATHFRIVLADGSIRVVDEQDPWFGAAQLALGSLGIVSAVTVKTQPVSVFTCVKCTVADEALETKLVSWAEQELYCKAWWFPEDGLVHRWVGREANPDEEIQYEAAGRELVSLTSSDGSLNEAVDRALHKLRHDTKDNKDTGDQFRTLTRFRNVSDVTGDLFQIFCNGVAAPQINLEIAVPLKLAGTVIRQLRRWYHETQPRLHYPIILRCTGPSTAWLSPAHDQPVCYFGFVVYYAHDGSISADGLSFLVSVERLLCEVGGRPHWAKHFQPNLYNWRRLYPRWDEFLAIRLDADPGAKFSNRFTHDVFGLTL